MNGNNETLIVEGINEKGYGNIPKTVMQDKDLSIEAKGIYAYMASYAGGGKTEVFPSVSKVVSDLGISEVRYRKHRKMLVEKGYIEIQKQKGEAGKFDRNVYILKQVIYKKNPTDLSFYEDGKHHDSETPSRRNDSTNNNSSFNNNNNTNNNSNNKNPSSELRYGPEDDCYKLADLLYKMAKRNNEKFKEPNMQKWSDIFRLMLEVDKYTPLEIQNLIVFSQNDDFWKGNILSPAKLRKQGIMLTNRRNEMLKRNGRYQQKQQALPIEDKNEYDDLSL